MTATGALPRLTTPVGEWPLLDREAWFRAIGPVDPLDLSIAWAQRWKPSTRKKVEEGYGRWLSHLAQSGTLDPAARPGERISQQGVRDYRDALRVAGNAERTVAGRLRSLAGALTAMEPSGDWNWLHRAADRIEAKATPVRDPLQNMRPAADVLQLGYDLMDAADFDRFRPEWDRAMLFRDGLMIAFLIQLPLRLGNLQSIALDQQLRKCGECWRIFIDGDDTKNSDPIECQWPTSLTEALEQYIRTYRPKLLKGTCAKRPPTNALWISKQGKAMTPAAIAYQIKGWTKETFGKPINPHMFRSIVATTIASVISDCVGDIQTVLGHRSSRTAEKYYNRSQMVGASAALNKTVGTFLKHGARKTVPSPAR